LLSLLREHGGDSDYQNDASLVISSRDGEIVCAEMKNGEPLDTSWLKQIPLNKSYGSLVANIGKKEHVIAYSISNVTGWVTAFMLPSSSFVSVIMRRILIMIMIMSALFILVSFVLSYMISMGFSRKIINTLKIVEQVGEGNFDTRLQYDRQEEFAFFYDRLNKMADNIKRLIYENYEVKLRQKDFEIMVLNVQLNPHFLYNTLNIINWICIEENAYRSSNVIIQLSRMLQYTSDNTMELTRLRNDIEWIRQYVNIMAIRYENKFSVVYDISDKLMEMRVPKLFLQPLIENAIIHGFKNIQNGGILNISGVLLEDEMLFSVKDNGIGMSRKEVAAVMEYESSSIGIQNTDKRIKMIYGDKYGLCIRSESGAGTIVTITLPVYKTGKNFQK
jgi:two-component system sensor histidine kinase YesM